MGHSLFGVSSPAPRRYHYVSESRTWLAAQSYCRTLYSDLATINSMEDMNSLTNEVDPLYIGAVWIGLKRGTQKRWGWSMGGDTLSQYSNWEADPNVYDTEEGCATKYRNGGWFPTNCNSTFQFVCYSDKQGSFILVSIYITWREALLYCRTKYTDLASIRNSTEHQQVSDLIKFVRYVWIGLFFDAWEWSDQGTSSFRYWGITQPQNLFQADCVAMIKGLSGKWENTICGRKLPFLCYKEGKQQIVRVKVSSDGNINLNLQTVRSDILKQIQQNLRNQGMNLYVKLNWRRNAGIIFQPEENKVENSTKRLCDEM
ncbi:macrophage mannose receptor 1-like [Astyanax mexicanus]|uniref:macrophage mannose receptor 1-like n=1 Tax=Astyanax mexicanus TaxID=7994 RepID=UPI0020CB3033|nr:macrophage mannose receptor 1-like [Astyanax mexicanus]